MQKSRLIFAAIIMGIVITLITGLINGPPTGLIGATGYGYPITWLRKLVLAPQYNPWRVGVYGIIFDIGFWFVIVLILFLLEERIRHPKSKSTTRKS